MSSGGRREGAGRPLKKNKKVALILSVSPDTLERMRKLSAITGVRQGAIAEWILEQHSDEEIIKGDH